MAVSDVTVRRGFWLLIMVGALMVTFARDVRWEFSWSSLMADGVGLAFVSLVLPRVLDPAQWQSSFLRPQFFPVKRCWNAWLFWLAICALAIDAACFLKVLLTHATVDYHLVRLLMTGGWLWLVHKGKVPGWNGAEEKREV